MKEFCFETQYNAFNHDLNEFNPLEFVESYYNFVRKAFYYHMDKVRTGTFVVWRSMIKYFEQLQSTPEFQKTKGILLEAWCREKMIENGFNPEKIILINSNRASDERLKKLREQINSFPKKPLEFELEFPEFVAHANFREIDLAFRHQHVLFVFECKGTRDPLSEEKMYDKWIVNMQDRYKLLNSKLKLIDYFLKNNLIQHEFFAGTKSYLPLIVQTEGIFELYTVPPEKFELVLKKLRKDINEGKFGEFF